MTVGHGDTTASTGAKKKPIPTYHADPARSEIMTNRNHRGIGVLGVAVPAMTSDCRVQVGEAITSEVDERLREDHQGQWQR